MKRFLSVAVGHHSTAVGSIRGNVLLNLPLRLHGIELGRPVDLLLDRDELRTVGFDVRCGDETHRFLPFATAAIGDDEIAIRSPLVLLEEDELAFYRARTFSLAELRRGLVERRGVALGPLQDVVVGPGGVLSEVVVEDDAAGERTVPANETIRLRPRARSAA